ncbi:MAG: DUF4136 domain-containing protein [Verrucomicrobia bacterium]|nr:DUF4136 domain-containing protein [Verrucomicrobiota bacterium]
MRIHSSRLHFLFTITAMTFVLSSCSTLNVDSDLVASSDLSAYSTYQWIIAPASAGGGKPRFDSPLLREQVRKSVDAELQQRGYQRVNQGPSDLLVGYFASVASKARVTQVDTSMGFSSSMPHYVNTSYMMPSTVTLVDQFEQGSLIVGIGSATTRQILWRGSAEAEIGLNDSGSRRRNRIQSAVSKMFRGFPKR